MNLENMLKWKKTAITGYYVVWFHFYEMSGPVKYIEIERLATARAEEKEWGLSANGMGAFFWGVKMF